MLRFTISNKREQQLFDHAEGPIEFGRGAQRNNVPRCIVQDLYVSKDHVRVDELEGGKVRVENLSQRNSIRLADNSVIPTGQSRDLDTPTRLVVGETAIDIDFVADTTAEGPLETIASPHSSKILQGAGHHSLLELGRAPTPETLTHWFETVIAVQRAAAGSPEFYAQTAKAIVSLVGLDRGLVILRRNGRWVAHTRYPDEGAELPGREFSVTIIDKVERERRTFFQSSATAASTTESLQGVEAVVASPIFDSHDQVVGAVYGCRNRFNPHVGIGIGPLEAQVMQLLASAVGVGLARMDQEQEAGRLRVQFEQFFSADLARELQRNPRLLEGQEREITCLFSDIRGFSGHSMKLGPTDTCNLVAAVMDRLTERVREFDGVVVDYLGDGLMAMWNAPADQAEHAVKACRAALAMLGELPAMNEEWKDRLGCPLRVGIGINTGRALCGNTGSRQKFKYGPLGHAVNLASRVEGATKQFGVPILITGTTHEQIGNAFATRRLCKVRVVGISQPVDLHELYAESASPEWIARRDMYEAALAEYEAGHWVNTCRGLYPLMADSHYGGVDAASLTIVARAVEALKTPPEHFDGVIDLTSK
jgi:adenylate cyclase